ncbi:Protein export cytoplasm protein SecA ATPase RNA helicase [Liberibacter crescens BT-1]|uniref:Protein translocase subunit SecA n=1 Tax=Liberibacter crescens (strain BT-1) TaxID=1215343 RepID=L0ETN2_LIBCB|nr:preprotein translocase subunit SecA [Liberibacter crescens]AGA64322.1 Protein export cytoplasm protein SecA ATPase RNA helicase [Liberibacter crescens BT-1]AMC12532.1 preprotein translocase subunit SecA [Liberibacter crescens]
MLNIAKLTRKLFGSSNDRRLQAYYSKIEEINTLEKSISELSDEMLSHKTIEFREHLKTGKTLDDLLVPAFAVAREAACRVLQMRPFDVQLIGGIILHEGSITEMKTGEGKTLAATLPVYLNALSGKGVHVVTVNDYLAHRDADMMSKVYGFLGLSTGIILHDMTDDARKAAYACDITYVTNNELGFDYLRDNMKYERSKMVQRGHNFAIIDEVDSILIDEARTPLIISGPLEDQSDLYKTINLFILSLQPTDYEVDEKQHSANFSEDGIEKIENMLRQANLLKGNSLYDIENVAIVHHINNALRAHKLFTRDKDYIVTNDEIIIIDEFTGRMMSGRRYSDGQHQALEAKENVTIQPENQTLSSITFQNYFRMYSKLAGMTGTASTEAEEFSNIYNLDVVEVPTNLPVIRVDEDDKIYRTTDEKYKAIITEILKAHEKHQPVLVGTTSIEKSEFLANLLRKEGFKKFKVLNARYHEQEAYIVSQAGIPGAVTIATNMAGRGTDIQLGGNATMRIEHELSDVPEGNNREERIKNIHKEVKDLKEKVIAAGGLYVIATERHESRRIDNQLRGRSGRQGDPGRSKFYLSLQDDLMRIFGSSRMDFMLQKLGLKEGEAIFHPWINKAIERAQKKVEARNFEIRKNLLKYDDVLNEQRKIIFEQRLEIIETENILEMIADIFYEMVESIIIKYIPKNSYPEQWDIAELKLAIKDLLNLDLPIEDWVKEDNIEEATLHQQILTAADAAAIEKDKQLGADIIPYVKRTIMLQTLDSLWRDHIAKLEHLRSVIGFRSYAQRDPLQEYKSEAFELFKTLINELRYNVIAKIMRVEFFNQQEEPKPANIQPFHINPFTGQNEFNIESKDIRSFDDQKSTKRIRRNDACSCGSGKKYKHCHGSLNKKNT